MAKTTPDMKVRLSADLREKIESAAKNNNRTMNAEIVVRLERSFREEDRIVTTLPSPDQEERLNSIERTLLAIIGDERFDKLDKRLASVEARLNRQST
ncbi:MAG TPA: Arc family DNA-binding protein [Opitutaceae bacterium]|nr:Arc family DNA-binding protein [Opitutaceae bacterium]